MTAAVTALVLYLLGLAAAFGWRSFAQWRATGDTGLRLRVGAVGSTGWWGKLLFIAALLLVAAAPVLVLAEIQRPIVWHPALPAAGLVIAVSGIALTLVAQRQMGLSWRVGVDPAERTPLITDGLFAHLRNPIFTGMLTVVVGLAGLVPTVVMLIALACLVAAVQIQVRGVEEPYLLATHGPAYRAYASRAGRFLPGVGRLAGERSRGRGLPG